jgi:chromosome segregation ATPase
MPGSPVSARVPSQRAPELRLAVDAGPPDVSAKAPANAPRNVRPAGRPGPGPKAKRDCGELRERCEQLRRQATHRGAAAARAALAVERAQEDLHRARRSREQAQDSRDAATAKASELSHAVAEEAKRLAEHRVEVDPAVERMTTHAAFAAYRRGDITADQLREVFRKAEGWTPQQDQLTHTAAQTRVEETDAQRVLDAALAAELVAEEELQRAAAQAQTADEEAREAAAEARAACAAAVDCEQGRRGRR